MFFALNCRRTYYIRTLVDVTSDWSKNFGLVLHRKFDLFVRFSKITLAGVFFFLQKYIVFGAVEDTKLPYWRRIELSSGWFSVWPVVVGGPFVKGPRTPVCAMPCAAHRGLETRFERVRSPPPGGIFRFTFRRMMVLSTRVTICRFLFFPHCAVSSPTTTITNVCRRNSQVPHAVNIAL